MFEITYPKPNERVVLVGLQTSADNPILFEEDIQEMIMLCKTAGADVVEVVIQKRDKPEASTYIGKGKLAEIRGMMREQKCTSLVIDAELSPGQIRTIEQKTSGKVIDRSQLILDIFALHARTNEARIQVELAQLRTLYPRLTHAWTHFSQQVGGIGTRGPGEKQLEVDRRLVQKKISDLRAKLKKVEKSRDTQRKRRRNEFNIALVGYTNVGKSSLLNALSGADVLVENKLFATLETSTRRTFLPEVGSVVISDTVGFIRKLPHHLVASFRSTLEVVTDADLLLIVMDASSAWLSQQLSTVTDVLDDLGAHDVPRMMVLNKSDLLPDAFERKKIAIDYGNPAFVSAVEKEGIDDLKQRIADEIRQSRTERVDAVTVTGK